MQNTVILTKFEALEERIEQLEAALKSNNNQINNVADKMKTLNHSLNKFQKRTAQELLEKEIYDKRFNLLIHGIEENTESAWETKWESENKFKQFLQNGLKIPNFQAVAVADVHRLPQNPITKNGKRITRPIIVKLTSYSDKNMIMRSLKNLKEYNEERKRTFGGLTNYIYVTEHLPRELQQQKKKLVSAYKEAKQNKQRTVWRIEKAKYCLYIDNVKHNPTLFVSRGRVDRASATEAVDSGLIPGRVKPKTIKIGIHSFPA